MSDSEPSDETTLAPAERHWLRGVTRRLAGAHPVLVAGDDGPYLVEYVADESSQWVEIARLALDDDLPAPGEADADELPSLSVPQFVEFDLDTGGCRSTGEDERPPERVVAEVVDSLADALGDGRGDASEDGRPNDDGASVGFDVWEALDAITQDTRASILADIVGHPAGMPSARELEYSNPDVSRSTIDEHLRTLVDAGVVAKERLPPGERSRDLPYTFYRLTPEARDLFDRNGIFDRDVWREQYERVEKTDDVLAAQNAPRPDVYAE
jgi:DNA-binding HxlR family transcriptional regulator